jgi:hypothetical protein
VKTVPLPRDASVEQIVEYLLQTLCDDLGLCLPDDKRKALATQKKITARKLALDVLAATGVKKPENETQHIRQIKRRFVQLFGDIVVEQEKP